MSGSPVRSRSWRPERRGTARGRPSRDVRVRSSGFARAPETASRGLRDRKPGRVGPGTRPLGEPGASRARKGDEDQSRAGSSSEPRGQAREGIPMHARDGFGPSGQILLASRFEWSPIGPRQWFLSQSPLPFESPLEAPLPSEVTSSRESSQEPSQGRIGVCQSNGATSGSSGPVTGAVRGRANEHEPRGILY